MLLKTLPENQDWINSGFPSEMTTMHICDAYLGILEKGLIHVITDSEPQHRGNKNQCAFSPLSKNALPASVMGILLRI